MRIQDNLKQNFKNKYQQIPIIVAAPGRINLIGEHIDYNGGLVFPASIDKYIYCAISKSQKGYCKIISLDLEDSFELDLNNIEKQEEGSWKNYILGVVWGILEMGLKLENFNLMFTGNIPLGAGLSSSAALENSVVFSLNELFKLKLTKNEMLKISVQAEHKFAGVLCGVMDQFASLNGKANHALLLDTTDLSFEYVPIELEDYQLLLINTNVKHQLSDSPYNLRKEQCNIGFDILQEKYAYLKSLSQASITQLNAVKDKMSHTVYQRCQYVIEENNRVKEAKNALVNKDWNAFGKLLFASHEGLRDLYEVSCEELDFLVDQAVKNKSVLGSRMMGGGFGGCTLNLIRKDSVDAFVNNVSQEYFKKFGREISVYSVSVSDGAQVVLH